MVILEKQFDTMTNLQKVLEWPHFASRSSGTSHSIGFFPELNLKTEKKSFRHFKPIESGLVLEQNRNFSIFFSETSPDLQTDEISFCRPRARQHFGYQNLFKLSVWTIAQEHFSTPFFPNFFGKLLSKDRFYVKKPRFMSKTRSFDKKIPKKFGKK